jgi:ATP-dependent Clp protease ATP-binding subunit ClpB
MDLLSYSDQLKQAIQIAQSIAKDNRNDHISPAHLLKAVMHKDFEVRATLKSLKKDIFYIEDWADVRIESYPKSSKVPDLPKADDESISVLAEADNIKIKLSVAEIDPISVFIAICTPGVGFSYEQLKSFPVTPNELFTALVDKASLVETVGKPNVTTGSGTPSQTSLLKYTIDKMALARFNKLEKVVGRDKEIRMIAEILGRRTNSNVLIIGDPGVGKSAVINGFCKLVAGEKSAEWLKGLMVFELSYGNLLAGASYKGEVEDRLHNIFGEIKGFDHAALIIEDIHELLDKYGSAPGAANIIKQELNKGDITLITTSTIDSFTKIIEKDSSFKRYFEIITIEESNDDEVMAVLSVVIPEYYEAHHGLKVSEGVLKESIRLTRRFLKERRLPSAAIDLVDRTMSVVRTAKDFTGAILDEIESELVKLSEAEQGVDYADKLKALLTRLSTKLNPVILSQLEEEINPNKFTTPEDITGYIQTSIEKLKEISLREKLSIEINDIAAVVSQKTNIPIGKLQSGEREKLLNANQYLVQRVVGQDHAIKTITEAILESRSGINKAGRPIGSFFFLGPTGTGKTELAKTLADFLFNDETAMIRFDMSEFKEEHSAALLYGAPPGYVGYEEGGMLVNKIRQRPYAVVLFDEIEKAHASVFDIFLQILDEGKLHDRLGKEGDFSNAVIIFTSNIGSKFIIDSFAKNEIPSSTDLMDIMSKNFRPEFLGRVDEIIPFAPIHRDVAIKILDIHMNSLLKILENKNIHLEIEQDAKEKLAMLGFNPQYGARPLIGIIRNQLRRPLSRMIISGELAENNRVKLVLSDEKFIWEIS